MTATLAAAHAVETSTIGAPRLLAALDVDLAGHLAVHGPLATPTPEKLTRYLAEAAIAGRGGAGFPFAAKLAALAPGSPVILVNGSESEPASWKDRTLLRRAPHLVLDGALAVAGALRASRVVVAVHDPAAEAAMRRAAAERGVRIEIRRTDGRFVAGEARALIRGLDDGPALPPGRRVHATTAGLGAAPTLASNVETWAQLAVLLRMGPARYRSTGTRAEPGTTLLSVAGAVTRPGVVEIPLGTPLGIVLAATGVHDPRAVVVGGYHGSWHHPIPNILLSRTGLAHAGGTFGAGVLLVLDGSTCALGELARVTGWLAAQSAKQCGPCTFGLPSLARDVELLWSGRREGLASALGRARAVMGRGACSHPDGASRFVTSGLHLLQDEVEQHARHGGCGRPIAGCLPVPA